jgi:hypothetical protein
MKKIISVVSRQSHLPLPIVVPVQRPTIQPISVVPVNGRLKRLIKKISDKTTQRPGIPAMTEASIAKWVNAGPKAEKKDRRLVQGILNRYIKNNCQGDVDFSNIMTLTCLPEGFNPQGNVDFHGCSALTHLPEGFNPQGDVDFSFCESLTHLPEGFKTQGNVYFYDCSSLTQLPESIFQMPNTATVYLDRSGLNATTVQRINDRQNSDGYNGPTFRLSVHDSGYNSEIETTASDLPSILKEFNVDANDLDTEGLAPNKEFWKYASSQTELGSPYNALARFLVRLLNEIPRSNGQIDSTLKNIVRNILKAMADEYVKNNKKIDKCTYIDRILAHALTGIDTCIDKVKAGYVLMQLEQRLYTAETVEIVTAIDAQIKAIGNTISFVDGVDDLSIVYDRHASKFVRFQVSANSSEEDQLGEISYTAATSPKTVSHEFSCSSAVTNAALPQIALGKLNEIYPEQFKIFRIGDPVEDILQLIYENQAISDVHKVDMRWSCCCTLKEPALIDQALGYISMQPVGA